MFLGVEIGGTKLQLGLGQGDGRLTALWRTNVQPTAGAEGIRSQIAAGIPELLAQAGVVRSMIRGAGVGFGGPIDDGSQSVIKSHQVEGWAGFPLGGWVTDLIGAPAVLGNDADVAGLGEALFGAGRGLSPIFYTTIGSGIGGGLIVDGRIYRGVGAGAAEIGHLKVPDFRLSAGAWVAVEEIASGWGIGRYFADLVANPPTSGDHTSPLFQLPPTEITAARIATLAADDPFTRATLDRVWKALAFAFAQMITLLCPRRIVIGGGVSLMGEILFDPLRRYVAEATFPPFAGITDIVPAALGEEVVVHGALALARQRVGAGGC